MIRNDQELEAILERIRHFQAQLAHLRKVETNPVNYRYRHRDFWRRSIECSWKCANTSACPPSRQRNLRMARGFRLIAEPRDAPDPPSDHLSKDDCLHAAR